MNELLKIKTAIKRTLTTGNYIQYTVITYNGNISEKKYIRETESLHYTLKTNKPL